MKEEEREKTSAHPLSAEPKELSQTPCSTTTAYISLMILLQKEIGKIFIEKLATLINLGVLLVGGERLSGDH